jgi:tetratricopeptide (TPR) repeat protein
LSSASATYPVAVILAYRKQGVELKISGDLLDSEIELGGVSTRDIAHLAEIVLGGPASPDLVELIVSRSEGNPYFAEQIIRYLQEESLLEMSSSGWRQVRRGRSSVLPQDISALLVARLDQLAREVKAVVQTASVLGREFEVRVLAQMLGPDAETEEYVSEAEKAAIWLPLREMRYIFYHALLRDAAYSMQMRARRRELHRLALGALETVYAGDLGNHYAELAYHAENGDLREKTQEYYTLAGRVSAGLYQNNQAVDYFSRALAYTAFDDLETQFDLVMERVEVLSRMAKRDLQLKDLDTLESWAGRLLDNDRLTKVMMLRSAYHFFLGNYQESIEYAQKAGDASDALTESDLAHYTQVVWATSLFRLGRMEEAMQRARSTLERAQALMNRNEECRILNIMGWIAFEQKESFRAIKYLAEALAIAREVKNLDVEAKALNNLAMAEGSLNGNYALAREYHRQASSLFQETGDRHGLGHSYANLGFVAAMQGDFPAARTYHNQAIRIAREDGEQYLELYTLMNLSSLDAIDNNAASARQNARQAVDLAQKTSDRSGEGWAMLYLGHAFLLQGDHENAHASYRKSLEIRVELDQPALSMEPIAGLVETYMAMGDLDSASQEAEKIVQFLRTGSTLEGTDEPLRVYHTCYRCLEKRKDPRSMQILQQAKTLLEAQVSKFSDETDRRRYVENIPWRRAIWYEEFSKAVDTSA